MKIILSVETAEKNVSVLVARDNAGGGQLQRMATPQCWIAGGKPPEKKQESDKSEVFLFWQS